MKTPQYAAYGNLQMLAAVLARARTPQTVADRRRAIGGDPAAIKADAEALVAAGRAVRIAHAPLPVAYRLAVRP